MEDFRLIVIGAAGLCSGAVLGAAIPTETERRIRGPYGSRLPFTNGSLLGVVLNQLLLLVVIGGVLTIVGIGILSAGSAYPLRQNDRYFLGVSWIIGCATAKWARYHYWRARDQWR